MKKILSILLTALVLLTVAVSCTQDVTVDENVARNYTGDTFMVNGKYFGTFEEALKSIGSSKAIGDQDDVVYLLKNASGPGAVIDGMDVTIDFQGYTFDFTNVDALIDGTSDQTFGLKITGESNVNLKGMEKISLFDDTAKLTMIYIENSTVSLEDAPKLQVEDNQYVFWVADGATLTIGTTVTTSKTNVSGGIKLEGASSVSVEESEVEIKDVVVEGTDALVSIDESATVTTTNVDNSKALNNLNTGSGTVAPEVVGHEHSSGTTKVKQIDGEWYNVTICGTCGAEMSKAALAFEGQARIDAVGYDTLASALKTARNGQTVTLLKDIDFTDSTLYDNNRFPISKSITIDGNNNTVTIGARGFGVGMNTTSLVDVTFKDITINNETSAGRCIDTRGNVNSLTLDHVTLLTNGGSYDQPLTIGGDQADAAIIIIKNGSSIKAKTYYAITTFNPVDMQISDSTIEGWACIYAKGPNDSHGSNGSSFTISNTSLYSKNIYTGVSNGFSMIITEDNDISVELEDCDIHCGYVDDTMIAFQTLFCLSGWGTPKRNFKVYVHGMNTTIDCKFTGETKKVNLAKVFDAWVNKIEGKDTFEVKIEKKLYNSLKANGSLEIISPYYWDDSGSDNVYLKSYTEDSYCIFGIVEVPTLSNYYGVPIEGTKTAMTTAYDTYGEGKVVAGYFYENNRFGRPSVLPKGFEWAEFETEESYHGFAYYLKSTI